jgi:hypothetical protein
MSPRRLIAVWVLAAAVALGAPGRARAADPLPTRITGIAIDSSRLLVSVGLQDLITDPDRQRLMSGFATRILIRVYLHQEGLDDPVAVAFQRAEIVYDLWDERFRVRVTRESGVQAPTDARTSDDVIWRTCALWHFPVADLARLRSNTRYFLAFRADLNPISEELLSDVRRWLVQPPRGQRRVGAGDSVFGSFVSIFVNPRVEDSERQVRFLSQPFTLALPPPRGSP